MSLLVLIKNRIGANPSARFALKDGPYWLPVNQNRIGAKFALKRRVYYWIAYISVKPG